MSRARPSIPAEEFATRRARAVEKANAAGFDALLVCSRGGGPVDRYADVMYLTNFYTPFPYTPDQEGAWSGRAHSFLVLPVSGKPSLVIDIPDDGTIHLDDGDKIYADLVIEATVQALKDSGLSKAKVGIVGDDVLPVAFYRKIVAALPDMKTEPADFIVASLRSIKSPAEIGMLRHASWLGSRMIETMLDASVPGATHGDIVAAGLQTLVPEGGILYNSFMASGRGGETPKKIGHAFPTWGSTEKVEKGDWIRFGISGMYGGYVFDLARAKAVGQAATSEQIVAFEGAIAAVEAGIAAVRPGATAGDLADAGLGRQLELGFPVKSVFSGMGHGVGLGWDVPWLVPGEPTPIVPNMVLCFERTVTRDGHLGDFEETVLVTEDGAELITDARKRDW